jgi:hypothetical protein
VVSAIIKQILVLTERECLINSKFSIDLIFFIKVFPFLVFKKGNNEIITQFLTGATVVYHESPMCTDDRCQNQK